MNKYEMRFWCCQIISYLAFLEDAPKGVFLGLAWGVCGLFYLSKA